MQPSIRMNDRMNVCMNERMTVVCMFNYLNGNKHIKEKKNSKLLLHTCSYVKEREYLQRKTRHIV